MKVHTADGHTYEMRFIPDFPNHSEWIIYDYGYVAGKPTLVDVFYNASKYSLFLPFPQSNSVVEY